MQLQQSSLRYGRLGIIVVTATLLTACAQPKMLYSWQEYQPTVYAYLKDDGTNYAEQIATLEKNAESARTKDVALPPGFRAHLGMLYLKVGDNAKAVEQFQNEKNHFPESRTFMDRLLRNAGQPASVAAGAPVPQLDTTLKGR